MALFPRRLVREMLVRVKKWKLVDVRLSGKTRVNGEKPNLCFPLTRYAGNTWTYGSKTQGGIKLT